MILLAAAGIACLLLFGIFNISFNLLESGIVTFLEHPVRAYFWAALLPVGALAVKVGWEFLKDPSRREMYLWFCLVAGLMGVIVWVGAYAAVYPTLSKTTTEHMESLNVFDAEAAGEDSLSVAGASGAKRMDMIIVAAQATAEIFLSAVLGIYMTMIYLKHRPVKLALNPGFLQLDADREYEFIEFEAPVDMREVEAAVNFFDRSHPGGLRGEVRVEFEGGIYQGEFQIRAGRGNRGRAGRTESDYWASLNLRELLRLPEGF